MAVPPQAQHAATQSAPVLQGMPTGVEPSKSPQPPPIWVVLMLPLMFAPVVSVHVWPCSPDLQDATTRTGTPKARTTNLHMTPSSKALPLGHQSRTTRATGQLRLRARATGASIRAH